MQRKRKAEDDPLGHFQIHKKSAADGVAKEPEVPQTKWAFIVPPRNTIRSHGKGLEEDRDWFLSGVEVAGVPPRPAGGIGSRGMTKGLWFGFCRFLLWGFGTEAGISEALLGALPDFHNSINLRTARGHAACGPRPRVTRTAALGFKFAPTHSFHRVQAFARTHSL